MSRLGWEPKKDRDGREIPGCWITAAGYVVAALPWLTAARARVRSMRCVGIWPASRSRSSKGESDGEQEDESTHGL